MLSKDANDLLCHIGPGTAAGNLIRRYWIPAVYPADLPAPDSPPVRVRLLGEDLIAFRSTDGSVGLVQNACLHSRLGGNQQGGGGANEASTMREDKAPKLAAVDTDFGVMIGARRDGVPGKAYWRANLFLFPFYHMSPGGAEGLARWSAWVPI